VGGLCRLHGTESVLRERGANAALFSFLPTWSITPGRPWYGHFYTIGAMPLGLSTAALIEQIRARVEEVLQGTAFFLIDVVVRGRPGAQVVEIFVDGDKGPSLRDLEQLSREIEFVLDSDDIIPGRYLLNVSSPGVERPLVFPRQYPKHIGRQLEIQLAPIEGQPGQRLRGTLHAADAESIELVLPDGTHRRLRYEEIQTARVCLPW
jgi:ribosome maturation factor RimP